MVGRDEPVGSRPALPRPVARHSLAVRLREWVAWFGAARLAVCALAVVAVGAGGFWLLRTPAAPVEAGLPMASSAGSAHGGSATTLASVARAAVPSSVPGTEAPGTSVAIDVLVHVAGAVAHPGVYRLEAGSRVVDAVLAAGGVSADADADAVNQAQVLEDGERVYVPSMAEQVSVPVGVSGGTGAASGNGVPAAASPSGPIDLNAASAEQLDVLPGIGPSTAAAIVAYREANGPFASVDDLADVRGIGPAKLDALRGLVTT